MSSPTPSQRVSVAGQLHHRLSDVQARAKSHESAALQILAELRRGAGHAFGQVPTADAALLRLIHLTPGEDGAPPPLTKRLGELLDDALLVGSLVALSRTPVRAPGPGRQSSFGLDLRPLLTTRESAAEGLATALLGATREDLPVHLRRAMTLLGSDGHGVDVAAVVRDLGDWGAEDQRVQKRWAYHFWSRASAGDPASTTTEETT